MDRDTKRALLIILFGTAAAIAIYFLGIGRIPFANVIWLIPEQIVTIYMFFFSLKKKKHRLTAICACYEMLFLVMMIVNFSLEYEELM